MGTRKDKLDLALLFLRLGTTAFGGPAAHTAMMHEEIVIRRKWLTETEFLDMVAACNFIPGPNSTELAIHIGYRRAGVAGLLIAGACFIVPAALLCTLIAYLYVRLGKLPIATNMLYAVKPVVIAIIVVALYKLARAVLKSPLMIALAALATLAAFWSGRELLILFGAGLLMLILRLFNPAKSQAPALSLPIFPTAATTTSTTTTAAAATTAAGLAAASLGPVFLAFLKIGSVLFGSGYVLLAFLQSDLVERYRWLTQQQLLDAVAVGQFTPGPMFTTATFIGYILQGPDGRELGIPGAAIATLGIFLPAFFFVALTAPLMSRLRSWKAAGYFLDGLNAGSLALMLVVTVQLARAALFSAGRIDLLASAVALLSLALLLWKPRVNSAWLILAAAILSLALPRHP